VCDLRDKFSGPLHDVHRNRDLCGATVSQLTAVMTSDLPRGGGSARRAIMVKTRHAEGEAPEILRPVAPRGGMTTLFRGSHPHPHSGVLGRVSSLSRGPAVEVALARERGFASRVYCGGVSALVQDSCHALNYLDPLRWWCCRWVVWRRSTCGAWARWTNRARPSCTGSSYSDRSGTPTRREGRGSDIGVGD
jgi:hypothetical protein